MNKADLTKQYTHRMLHLLTDMKELDDKYKGETEKYMSEKECLIGKLYLAEQELKKVLERGE